jgi:hypothetical protein
MLPIITCSSLISHFGQGRSVPASTLRSNRVPHAGQNFDPSNAVAKQAGHEMVASRAPQCPQFGASVRVGAPHIGQLSVPASISILDEQEEPRNASRQMLLHFIFLAS